MSQFYVSIIFIGLLVVVIALISIALDFKKSIDNKNQITQKKDELSNIISDAELMVEELNKFSDYVVNQMELKNIEMSTNLLFFEEKINQLNMKMETQFEKYEYESNKVVNGYSIDYPLIKDAYYPKKIEDVKLPLEKVTNKSNSIENSTINKIKDNVIPLNNKYKEVFNLAEKGVDHTEIAKKLNMGKGEIQLILGISKS